MKLLKAVKTISNAIPSGGGALKCEANHVMVERPARHCICMECNKQTFGGNVLGCMECPDGVEVCINCSKIVPRCDHDHILHVKTTFQSGYKCRKCGRKELNIKYCLQVPCHTFGYLCFSCCDVQKAKAAEKIVAEPTPKSLPPLHPHLLTSYKHKPDSIHRVTERSPYTTVRCLTCSRNVNESYQCRPCMPHYMNCVSCYEKIGRGIDPAEAKRLTEQEVKEGAEKQAAQDKIKSAAEAKKTQELEDKLWQQHVKIHAQAPDCGKCGAKGGNSGNVWMCQNLTCNAKMCAPCYRKEHGFINTERCTFCIAAGVYRWCQGKCS